MQLHTAAFAFTEKFIKTHTWVKMTLSIEDMMAEGKPGSAALPVEGSGRWKECLRWKASQSHSCPRCVSGERECSSEGKSSAFAPNVVTDAYRPHPPAIGAEWSIPRIRPVP